MRRLLVLAPLALFIGVVTVVGVRLVQGGDPAVVPSALIGQPAPAFALPPLPGRAAPNAQDGLARSDLGDGPVLVNVWASWCPPCYEEHDDLMRLAAQGVTIHGINYKDRPEAAVEFLTGLGDPFDRIGVDTEGRTAIDWGVYGVPETFVVDGDGIIRLRFAGPVTPDVAHETLLPLLDSLSAPEPDPTAAPLSAEVTP